jgi:predicted transcriptional regulator
MNIEKVDPHLTVKIVQGYVRHHRLGPDQLADVIASVHRTLGQLGQQVQPAKVLTPAVSIRQSVHRDYVVCLDCGYRGKTLRRHISSRHGLTGDEYRKRWGLRNDHPLTAPAYSEHRSTLAKELGLGRKSVGQRWLRHRRQGNLLRQISTSKSRRAPNRGGPVAPDRSPTRMRQPQSRRRDKGDRVLGLLRHNLSHLRHPRLTYSLGPDQVRQSHTFLA